LFLFLALVLDVDAVRDGKCPSYGLPCKQNGICMYGSKDYQKIFDGSYLPDISSLTRMSKYGMYCDCGEDFDITGYTGLYCDVQYDKCPGDNNYICLNGSTCILDSDDPTFYICDCAKTSKGGNKFEGTNCQHETTEWCEGDSGYDISESGSWYCTNDGSCRNGETSPVKMCDCNEGFYGLHCEFTEKKECTMECENGGLCKHGIKDYSSVTDDTKIIEFLSKKTAYETHCVCPAGFTGLNCEIAVSDSQCGDGNCFYDAPCVQDTCDCKSISMVDVQYSGDYCEVLARPTTKSTKSHHKHRHVAEDVFFIFFFALCLIVALFFGALWSRRRISTARANAPIKVAQDENITNPRSTFIGEIGDRNIRNNDDYDNENDVGDDDLSFEDEEGETQMEII